MRRAVFAPLAAAGALSSAIACYGQAGVAISPDVPASSSEDASSPPAPVRPANPSCTAPPKPSAPAPASFVRVLPSVVLTQPTQLLQAPGDGSRWFAVEQGGKLATFPADGSSAASPFVDISARVVAGGEAGFLSAAFHPQWRQNRQLFLSYTGPSATTTSGIRSIVSRVALRSDFSGVDPNVAEQIIFSVDQPYRNHNGGQLAFGSDGYLYFSLGDGGAGNDPDDNGQNTNVVFGKILRLDVDGGSPYAIPPDNPFASGGGRPEIFAYGLRNPWRFSFDRLTGDLWAGDVGQSRWEEIDRIVKGGNYGWRLMEGPSCLIPPTSCSVPGLVPPVVAHGRSEATSIVGGYVYRGTKIPAITGRYVYGDFGVANLWVLMDDPKTGGPLPVLLNADGPRPNVSAFGQALDGELFLTDYGTGGVYQMVPPIAPPERPFPRLLTQTGCVDPSDATKPATGVVPYDVGSALWSDGAQKERFFAIPDDQHIAIDGSGDMTLPPGGVTMKTFSLHGRRVETRLFVRHLDGTFAGYTYAWNDAQTDATLVDDGATVTIGGDAWTIPTRAQCMQCHTEGAGFSLGLEAPQLDHAITRADGRRESLFASLDALGYFTPRFDAAKPLPGPFDDAPLEARARAYLHANCAGCHRPQSNELDMDLRFSTPTRDMNVCDRAPDKGDLGIAGARRVKPKDPDASLIVARMSALDGARMPPLATKKVDVVGLSLVRAWIAAGGGCP